MKFAEPPTCPNNQVYNVCHTACPNICGEETSKICTFNCVAGCGCPPDLFKTKDGRCVKNEDCPISKLISFNFL